MFQAAGIIQIYTSSVFVDFLLRIAVCKYSVKLSSIFLEFSLQPYCIMYTSSILRTRMRFT
jgi:hypothetical protein